MADYGKMFSLSYDSAVVTKGIAPKSHFLSVRLVRDPLTINPGKASFLTNILLCGNCIDRINRKLYVFYIDTFFNASWIIEFDIDNKIQKVVYYGRENEIGFNPDYKIYNARVVHGRIIWTDDKNWIYQVDIERAKRSFAYGIGYGPYPTSEWNDTTFYYSGHIVSYGARFYRATVNNSGVTPTFDGETWTPLCLIEDAYYSTNIENFYFAPLPPRLPPVIKYLSDDSRRINNLRQTLFQIAYRYVYMDWRRSTFSPASIVALPQNEEKVTSGLANEQISLNNALRITVNLGGEEVRQVEIIGRSSADPSQWFLIEIINKFEEQEREGEVSEISELPKMTMTITIKKPTAISSGESDPEVVPLTISIMPPTVEQSWVHPNSPYFQWLPEGYGSGSGEEVIFDIPLGSAIITSKPSWLTVINSLSHILFAGSSIFDDEIITIYPTNANTGGDNLDNLIVTDSRGNTGTVVVYQEGLITPVIVNIILGTAEDYEISNESYTANTGLNQLIIGFDHTFSGNIWKTINVMDDSLSELYSGSGYPAGVLVRSGYRVSKIMTLSRSLVSGDILTVKIGNDL